MGEKEGLLLVEGKGSPGGREVFEGEEKRRKSLRRGGGGVGEERIRKCALI